MTKDILKSSSIMLVSILIANVFAYFLQVYFGRVLGPIDYGTFGTLMSILMMLSVPISVVGNVVTKFVSKFKAREEYGKINSFVFSAVRKLFIYGLFGFFVIAILSPFITSYINIDSKLPIIFVGATLVFSVMLPITRGALQGLQKFNDLAFNNVFESIIRFVLGVVLLKFGLGVNGAVLSYGLGYLSAFLIAFVSLRFLFGKEDRKIDVSEIYNYTYPVLIAIACLSILINFPTILVKHYFSSLESGYWNAALTISRLIGFVGAAFSGVMFANVAEGHERKEETRHFLNKSLIYVSICSLGFLGLIWLFPEFVVRLLFSSGYEGSVVLLKAMGLVLVFNSLNLLIINYELILKRFKVVILLVILTILETGLIFLLHNTLLDIIYIMLGVNFIVFVVELIRTSNLLSRFQHHH